jgi:hypothetical protein
MTQIPACPEERNWLIAGAREVARLCAFGDERSSRSPEVFSVPAPTPPSGFSVVPVSQAVPRAMTAVKVRLANSHLVFFIVLLLLQLFGINPALYMGTETHYKKFHVSRLICAANYSKRY